MTNFDRPIAGRRRPIRTGVALLVVVSVRMATGAAVASAGAPTYDRQVRTLADALGAFDEAARVAARDPRRASELYEKAAAGFESLIADGVRNGRLFYNLGNTYVRLGRLGKAIASYRRAAALMPDDPNLRENLRFARTLRQDQIAPPETATAVRSLLFWHYGVSMRWRANIALAAYVAFWALLAAGRLVRGRLAALVWASRAAGLTALMLGASVLIENHDRRTTQAGVLITDGVVLRKGNGEAYEPQYNYRFSDGLEFDLVEPPRGDWLHIRLPDDKDGWVRSDQVELI